MMPSLPSRPASSSRPAWTIAVAGGGPPGLAFGLAVARSLGPAVQVSVLDPDFASPRPDRRAYALSPGAVAMLRTLGVWERLAASATPILSMTITDGRVADLVRPDYLGFSGHDGEPLAHMVEAAPLAETLRAAAAEAGVSLRPTAVTGPHDMGSPQTGSPDMGPSAGSRLALVLSTGETLPCSLLVAADGARSRLREAVGITTVGRAYPQIGIVGTVRHGRDHAGRAIQHFLPSGPFAILPLRPDAGGFRSSIVWTERADAAPALLALPPADLERELALRFGPQYGVVALEGPLASFPLSLGLARRYVGRRVALVGDAAHHIHPLAGQGLNLGLADVACLAERVVDAVRLGLDPGAPDTLAAFERDRRFDAVRLAGVTDGLDRLFSNDLLAVRVLRDIGLGLVDRAGPLKARLLEAAAGAGRRAPRLLRGEPL